MEIKVIENENTISLPAESELGFGHYFTNHMFMMDWEEGKGWIDARIVPFGNISLHPASTVLHYGAEIFEGLKAYRTESGNIQLNDVFIPRLVFRKQDDMLCFGAGTLIKMIIGRIQFTADDIFNPFPLAFFRKIQGCIHVAVVGDGAGINTVFNEVVD